MWAGSCTACPRCCRGVYPASRSYQQVICKKVNFKNVSSYILLIICCGLKRRNLQTTNYKYRTINNIHLFICYQPAVYTACVPWNVAWNSMTCRQEGCKRHGLWGRRKGICDRKSPLKSHACERNWKIQWNWSDASKQTRRLWETRNRSRHR